MAYLGVNVPLLQNRKESITKVINASKTFLDKANKIHDNKYDYSKVEYTGCHNHVTIICPKHGEFKMSPNVHLNGSGCPKCGIENQSNKQRSTTWMDKANKIHNNKYDYSQFDYINGKTKSTIICPIHGPFEMDMLHHYRGQGCKECSKNNRMSFGERKVKEFLDKNNLKYEYNFIIMNDDYLKNKPYDFYIESLNLLIEFQGEQHRKKKFHMTDADLDERKKIDANKKMKAKKLKYNYIAINDIKDIEVELNKVLSSTTIETK